MSSKVFTYAHFWLIADRQTTTTSSDMSAMGPAPAFDVISDEAVRVAQIYYGVTIPLVALGTATCAYRMLKSTRSRSVWSDTCIIIGYVGICRFFSICHYWVQQSMCTANLQCLKCRLSPSPTGPSSCRPCS